MIPSNLLSEYIFTDSFADYINPEYIWHLKPIINEDRVAPVRLEDLMLKSNQSIVEFGLSSMALLASLLYIMVNVSLSFSSITAYAQRFIFMFFAEGLQSRN